MFKYTLTMVNDNSGLVTDVAEVTLPNLAVIGQVIFDNNMEYRVHDISEGEDRSTIFVEPIGSLVESLSQGSVRRRGRWSQIMFSPVVWVLVLAVITPLSIWLGFEITEMIETDFFHG